MKISRHSETGFFRVVNPAPRATPRLMAAVLTLAVLALLAVLACGCAGENVTSEAADQPAPRAAEQQQEPLHEAWLALLPVVAEIGICAEEQRPPTFALHDRLIEIWRAMNPDAIVIGSERNIRGAVEQRAAAADAELPPQEGAPP